MGPRNTASMRCHRHRAAYACGALAYIALYVAALLGAATLFVATGRLAMIALGVAVLCALAAAALVASAPQPAPPLRRLSA